MITFWDMRMPQVDILFLNVGLQVLAPIVS